MPELPEVEFGRRLAEEVAVGRRILVARCARDPIVFEGVSPTRIRRALEGRTVEAVVRRGKYIWFELDRRPWPVFHFGMTGSFRVPERRRLALASSPKHEPDAWPPRYTKLHLRFRGGAALAMTNARRLGRIRLLERPADEPPISRLGFDPLLDMPTPRTFHELLARRSIALKSLLLDQSFAAGVGNWIADEVLYQAGLDPRRPAGSLTRDESRRLHAKLRSVICAAVRVNADKNRFPKTWLFHHRWGKGADAHTSRGERIVFLEIGGRTTAWVPERQSGRA